MVRTVLGTNLLKFARICPEIGVFCNLGQLLSTPKLQKTQK